MKEYTSVVAIIARNETKYIQECILHNHILGFDKIIIVLHGEQDDDTREKIEQVKHIVDADVLDLCHPIADAKKSVRIGHQKHGYRLALEKYKDRTEWLALFDVDECLWIKGDSKINDLLSTVKKDVGLVWVPWLFFNHNNKVVSVPEEESRYSWFNRSYRSAMRGKSIIRTRMADFSHAGFHVHVPNTTGRMTDFGNRPWLGEMGNVEMCSVLKREVVLAHYFTGSMEDWVARNKRRAIRHSGIAFDVNMFLEHTHKAEMDNRMMQYHDQMMELKSNIR